MLRDRKVLLEQELVRAKNDAANMYLSIVVGGNDLHSKEYQDVRQRVSMLERDLNQVCELLLQGHN